jgi:hypothetical protein
LRHCEKRTVERSNRSKIEICKDGIGNSRVHSLTRSSQAHIQAGKDVEEDALLPTNELTQMTATRKYEEE